MKRLLFLILLGGTSITPVIWTKGEVIIEGTVKLPPAKASSAAASARYQIKSGTIAAPDPPKAVVYLEGTFPPAKSGSLPPKEVKQKGCQFDPGLLAIQKGTEVTFPNNDDDYHHVFSYSKVKEFDLGRFRKDEKPAGVVFDKTGVVKVGCEIHEHMRAVILVLDTPHITKTDVEGKYSLVLKNVPDGKYLLKAWVDEKNVREQTVEVKEGAKLQVDFPGK